MHDPIVPNDRAVVNRLTRQQRLVWQRLTQADPAVVNDDGYVETDWLARAWGDDLPGSPTLVHVTVHNINKRLAPIGLRIRGRRGNGYQVVRLDTEGCHA